MSDPAGGTYDPPSDDAGKWPYDVLLSLPPGTSVRAFLEEIGAIECYQYRRLRALGLDYVTHPGWPPGTFGLTRLSWDGEVLAVGIAPYDIAVDYFGEAIADVLWAAQDEEPTPPRRPRGR